ncbi:MAG: redoxin domain-containing protein [Janthinobacterium lividum]
MKYFLIFTLIILNSSCSYGQSKNYNVQVRGGYNKRLPTAYMWHYVDRQILVDSAHYKKNAFTFEGEIKEAYKAYLVFGKKWSQELSFTSLPLSLYIEPGKTNINVKDSLINSIVSSGPINSNYANIRPIIKRFEIKQYIINNEFHNANSEDSRIKIKDSNTLLSRERQTELLPLMKKMTNSIIYLDFLNDYNYTLTTYEELAPLYNNLSPTVKQTPVGKEFARRLAALKQTSIGTVAPSFSLPDSTGKAFTLDSFKGKFILIEFWASWCAPCRAEIPNLKLLHSTYRKHSFNIVSVSMDTNRSSWTKAIKNEQLQWTQISDLMGTQSKVAKLYHIEGIPQNFLVGPDGKLIAKNLYGKALALKLAELL